MSTERLIAVCGYSDGRGAGLHDICVGRLRRAEREAGPNDVVLLSGWARGSSAASEAELMARSWRGSCRRVVLDKGARSTFGNVSAAAALARTVDAKEVLLVTSGWHARRAGALLRAALSGSGSRVGLATTDERPSLGTRMREIVSWAVVPFAALSAARRGEAASASASRR
jgi:uncharacterized SAM-binding protein YcdF (DUF218 family)